MQLPNANSEVQEGLGMVGQLQQLGGEPCSWRWK